MLEIYSQQIQIYLFMQQYERALQALEQRSALAQSIYGVESEQYCQFLEDEIQMKMDMNLLPQAQPILEKLIRILKEMHGGENDQKILQCYEKLSLIMNRNGLFTEGLVIVQKKISIYKAINGDSIIDGTMTNYVTELGMMNYALKKFDDAISNWKDAEKLVKKLGPDQNPKEHEAQIKKFIAEAQKKKAEDEKAH